MVPFSEHRKWGRLAFELAAPINLCRQHIDLVSPHPLVALS
jgi:hypothetical protein